MVDLIRDILAFMGTFIVISTSIMLLLQCIVCCISWDWRYKKNTDYRIVIIGIIIALFTHSSLLFPGIALIITSAFILSIKNFYYWSHIFRSF